MNTVRIKTGYGTIQQVVMVSGISQHAKLVYCLFVSYAGSSGQCFPSLTTITKNLKMGRGTVTTAIKELIDIGLLASEARYKKDKSRSSNVYYPMMVEEGSSLPEPPPDLNEGGGSSQPERGVVPVENSNINLLNTNPEQFVISGEITENQPDQNYVDVEYIAEAEEPKAPPVAPAPPVNNHPLMMDIYWKWYKENNEGIQPKIDGAEGKGMKDIVQYMEGVARFKLGEEMIEATPEAISEKTCNMFRYILKNWTRLEPFLQKQVKIQQISSNLTNIINNLKNGRTAQTAQQQKADRAGTIAEGFAGIDEAFREQG